jgi:hypothetical protein
LTLPPRPAAPRPPRNAPQIINLPLEDFKLLLTERNLPLLTAGGKGSAPAPARPLSAAARACLASVAPGGSVARLAAADAAALGLAGGAEGGEGDDGGALAASAPLAICAWRTRASLSVLVSKTECDAMLERIAEGERRRRGGGGGGGGAGAAGAGAAGDGAGAGSSEGAGATAAAGAAAEDAPAKKEPALALA